MNTNATTATATSQDEAKIGLICADLTKAGVASELIGSIWDELHGGNAVRLARAIHWAWGAHPKVAE